MLHRLQSRRKTLLAGGLLALSFVCGPTVQSAETAPELPAKSSAESWDLTHQSRVGETQVVKAVVEVTGDLKLNSDGTKVERLPIKVTAELDYVQRLSTTSGIPGSKTAADGRMLRYYRGAKATMKLRDSEMQQTLSDSRRLMMADIAGDQAVLFSPAGPLTREELELVDVPASQLVTTALLPGKSVAIGDTWTYDDAIICRLLGLEAVQQQSIVAKLEKVEIGVAMIALEGKVSGAVGGVASDIELKGRANFDLGTKVVSWLVLAIRENRSIGHAQPGFEAVTKLRMVAAPAASAPEFAADQLSGLPLEPNAGSPLMLLKSERGAYELIHDRRWRTMIDRSDVTILRMVDRGDLVAQCNISRLPPLAKDKQLTMDGFQADIRRTLGKNFGEIIDATEQQTDSGLRMLRVTASGVSQELPIQWTYYNISNTDGEQLSLVVTMESKLVEKFPEVDRELTTNIRLFDLPKPTPSLNKPKIESATSKPATSTK